MVSVHCQRYVFQRNKKEELQKIEKNCFWRLSVCLARTTTERPHEKPSGKPEKKPIKPETILICPLLCLLFPLLCLLLRLLLCPFAFASWFECWFAFYFGLLHCILLCLVFCWDQAGTEACTKSWQWLILGIHPMHLIQEHKYAEAWVARQFKACHANLRGC